MKQFSKLTTGLAGQPMFDILSAVMALEAQGRKVYRFEVGDSDIDAYPHIIDATKEALDNRHTRYVGGLGIDPLRQAICAHTERTLGFRPDVSQVIVMPANGVIDFVVRCVADPGDEVIFSDPGFPTYIAVTSYLGMKTVKVPLRESNDFCINPEDLRVRITDKTRLVINTSPGNPTGAVMSEEQLLRVAEIVKEHDVYLLSDEIYAQNIYDSRHYSPGIVDKCRERTIILNGFSKAHSMSGWRLGYAIGPTELITKMGMMFNTIYSCLPPFIQYAGISALNTQKHLIQQRTNDYRQLRDAMITGLNEIPGVSCNTPQGALYVFPNITGTGLTSKQFAQFVLDKAGVSVVPGTCFGDNGEGYVRLCYTRNKTMIKEACEAMKVALTTR